MLDLFNSPYILQFSSPLKVAAECWTFSVLLLRSQQNAGPFQFTIPPSILFPTKGRSRMLDLFSSPLKVAAKCWTFSIHHTFFNLVPHLKSQQSAGPFQFSY